jgi:cell division GTPase FtsZ
MFGATIDDSLKDEVRVTVIATGLNEAAANASTAPRRPADPYQSHSHSDVPPDIQEAQEEREELKPIRESNFRLINEDITPPFLRDWKKRTDRG